MTTLSEHLDNYLAVRRALGFKLVNEDRMLRDRAWAKVRPPSSRPTR
jgi:hypothetical protein